MKKLLILGTILIFSGCLSEKILNQQPVFAKKAKPFALDMVHHNPGEAATVSKFNDPAVLAEMNYNGQVINDYVQAAVTFETFDKNLFKETPETLEWISNRAQLIREQISAAQKAGIEVYYFTDFLVFPKALVNKNKRKMCNIKGELDIQKPLTQQLVRIQLTEIFNNFPEIDGLVVRTGEVYEHNVPHHQGNNPVIHGLKDHKVLLQILKEELCEKRDKTLIYRTWDFGFLHTNPTNYLKLSAAIEPHEKMFFSIKHTEGDFHRTMKFNPTIGIGRHRQLIEVQCQREYEGKGAHPDYVANGVWNGFEELEFVQEPERMKSLSEFEKSPLYAGVWTWTRGGGWLGPYITNEFWCELNAYVTINRALNPDKSEEEIFFEFAKKSGIETSSLEKFRELALLSADGVLRGRAAVKGGVNVWWTRDHFIGVPPAFEAEALADKHEAVEIWNKIEALSKEVKVQNAELKEFIEVSSTYGRIKYSIFEKAWEITDLVRKGLGNSNAAANIISEYDELWKEWKELKETYECCPTLYNDEAMGYSPETGAFGKPGIGAFINKYRK